MTLNHISPFSGGLPSPRLYFSRGPFGKFRQGNKAPVLRLLCKPAPLRQFQVADVGHLPLGRAAEHVLFHDIPRALAILFADYVAAIAGA